MSNDRLNDDARWDELGTPPWLHLNSSQLFRPRAHAKSPKKLEIVWEDFASPGMIPMHGKPFQSKLEPFYEFIREGRSKRWSYQKIAEALTNEKGLSVSANAVFSFVKVRAKRRRLYALPSAGNAAVLPSRHHKGA